MDQKQILKQMTEVNKLTFNNAFDAMELLQDQSEKITSAVLDKVSWFPPESRKAADAWVEAFKDGRQSLRQQIDDSYKQMETLFPSQKDEGSSKS